MALYAQTQKNISNWFKNFKQQASGQYAKEALLGGILLGVAAGYFGYGFYAKNREQQAFGALSEVVDSFEKAQYDNLHSEKGADKDLSENKWQDTEILLEALYKQNKRSYLAPYFLIFKSQIILERGGSIDEALKILEEALEKMPKKSSLFEFYNLKRILMSFDSQEELVRKEALHDLIATAKDEKGYAFEEASYLLGIYYISGGDMQNARDVLENALKFADKKALLPSGWVKQIEEKLESIK